MASARRRFRPLLVRPPGPLKVLIFLLAMVAYASSGFLFFERELRPEYQWVDAVWWAVVTMTTVGFGDYFPQTLCGRLLIGFPTMLVGMGMLGYAVSQLAGFFIRADTFNRKGFVVRRCKDPILVCNYPSRSRFVRVLHEIRAKPGFAAQPVIVVDEHLEELDADLVSAGVHFVRGSPARAYTLEKASLAEALRAVVLAKDPTCAESDHLTASVCLALHSANADLPVVAECVDPDNEELLFRAGARSVVCVLNLAPGILVNALDEPGVVDVIQELAAWEDRENSLCIVPIESTSSKTYAALRHFCTERDVTLLGLRNNDTVRLNPPRDYPLGDGEAAIVICRTAPSRFML